MTQNDMPNETFDWNGLREKMRAAADRGNPQAWIPDKPADDLLGVVTAIKPGVRTAFGVVPVLELTDPVGAAWSLWLLHTVLRREVIRARPIIGETLYVRYEGQVRPDGGGALYENYTVLVDRPDQNNELDWDRIAQRYEPDTADRDPLDQWMPPHPQATPEPAPDEEDIPF